VPIALTIAGSDSGGGAGIQADLKTFHQFGVHGTTAIVAVTAQNTMGVTAVHAVPPDVVDAQLDALAADLPPHAAKTGMLATAPLVRQVAAAIERYAWRRYVLDPVMVSTSGARLLSEEAEQLVLTRLVPLAAVVTPNLEEAEVLARHSGLGARHSATVEWMVEAGRLLLEGGAGAALVKGGHLERDELVDVLITRSGVSEYRHPRIPTTSTHGTGCTLSAAITGGLARWAAAHGDEAPPLELIVADAVAFVQRAIAAAPGLGAGHGPVSHFVETGRSVAG